MHCNGSLYYGFRYTNSFAALVPVALQWFVLVEVSVASRCSAMVPFSMS